MVFQFASTNLVFELGIVIWIFLGWQFTLAELVGGLLLIVLMWIGVRLLVSRREEEQARARAQSVDEGHQHHSAGGSPALSLQGWSDVAHNFRGDWQMLWKEIGLGFVLAGFIGLLGDDFFNFLFIENAPSGLRTLENVLVGPLIAVLSFVCSVGNVPLAAVLWSGGIGFAGVMAFIFADLIVIPILLAYRKYYGTSFALKITALMFLTMVLAALFVDLVFGWAGLIPTGARPSRSDVFGSVEVNYKLFLNVLGLVVFAALFALTWRRGATDPVCGMKVDRSKAVTASHDGHTYYFCSEHCRSKAGL